MANIVNLTHIDCSNKPFEIISFDPRKILMEFKVIKKSVQLVQIHSLLLIF